MSTISIIVPVYNVSRYLSRCLTSLSFLLSDDNEMIIVNDGSTDDSLSIAEDFAKNYSNVSIVTQENGGLSAARNTGMRFAHGEYLWFVDSDDYIDKNQFQSVYKEVSSCKYDAIVFGRIDDLGDKMEKRVFLYDKEYLSGVDYFKDSISHDVYRTNAWDKIFRRTLLEDNNITFIEGRLYEDMLFCQYVFLRAKRVRLLNVYPYIYNLTNGGSITKQIRRRDLDVLWYIDLFKKEFLVSSQECAYDTKSLNMLLFNWVNSCLLKKYIPMIKENAEAKEIVTTVFDNITFKSAVKYCACHHVLIRQMVMAWIILIHPYIYCIIVSKMLK